MSRVNSNIILSLQQPDLVNAFGKGQALRAREDELSNQNALRGLFQAQGPNILAGDPNALNDLSRHSPQMAMDFQGQHQVQRHRDRTQSRLDAQEQREIDAAELERDLGLIKQGVAQATVMAQNGDLAGVNNLLSQVGHAPLSDLSQFPAVVAQFTDATTQMEDFLKAQQPDEPADEYQRYVQEERAAGRAPLSRIEFAQAKKGSGVSVTTADGTMVSFGGAQQGPGFGTKATNEIEGRILDSGAMLGRLNDTRDLFKPEYLEFETRIGAKIGQWMDKAGRATAEQQELVANFAQFKTEAFNNLNTSLKELSGAAVTPQEATRLNEQLPNVGTGVFDGDSPTEFQAKLEQSIAQQQRAVARYNLWLATGRQGKPWEMGSLDDVDTMINQRGAQIEKQLKANGITDPEVLKRQVSMQLRKEVGF